MNAKLLRALCESHARRGDDCGRLARDVITFIDRIETASKGLNDKVVAFSFNPEGMAEAFTMGQAVGALLDALGEHPLEVKP